MKPILTGAVGAVMLALSAVSAQADCAAELARLTEVATTDGGAAEKGIAKDGSLAPLQNAADMSGGQTNVIAPAQAAPDAPAENRQGIAKDGSHVPLDDAAGSQPGVAMSGADAQAQQEGQPTAAEQAAGSATGQDRDASVEQARAALAAGDEDACLKHLRDAAPS